MDFISQNTGDFLDDSSTFSRKNRTRQASFCREFFDHHKLLNRIVGSDAKTRFDVYVLPNLVGMYWGRDSFRRKSGKHNVQTRARSKNPKPPQKKSITMDENKKGFINEDDIATLLQRYTATTILALLQEVAHSSSQSERIDWDQLVAKTTTGITSPREYRMLWRHLAYREPLPDKHNDITRPEDVDSDYEYEVEVAPPVTADTSEEVTACVKVLIASGLPSERGQSSAAARGLKNITVPGSIKKQTLRARTTAAAKKPAMAPRRKRQNTVKMRIRNLITDVNSK